jgi:hypothetical protein
VIIERIPCSPNRSWILFFGGSNVIKFRSKFLEIVSISEKKIGYSLLIVNWVSRLVKI